MLDAGTFQPGHQKLDPLHHLTALLLLMPHRIVWDSYSGEFSSTTLCVLFDFSGGGKALFFELLATL